MLRRLVWREEGKEVCGGKTEAVEIREGEESEGKRTWLGGIVMASYHLCAATVSQWQ